MKDFNGEIQYKDRTYKIVFNLNVMEIIQGEYGSLDAWADLTDGKAYAKKEYENKCAELKGHHKSWDELTEEEQSKYSGEPDVKAVIFGFMEMINEGIDIDNEDNGTDEKHLTAKQVGRIITEIGLANATKKLNETVIESSKSEEKNV